MKNKTDEKERIKLYGSLGLKPIPNSARKNPKLSAVQVVRRLRTKIEKGTFIL